MLVVNSCKHNLWFLAEEESELESEQDGEEEDDTKEKEVDPVLKGVEAVVEAGGALDGVDDREGGQAGDEFTDKKHESQFCLETNIPTEGDPDGEDDTTTEGDEGEGWLTLKHSIISYSVLMYETLYVYIYIVVMPRQTNCPFKHTLFAKMSCYLQIKKHFLSKQLNDKTWIV